MSQRPAATSSSPAVRRRPVMNAAAETRLITIPIIVRWFGRSRRRKSVRPTGSLHTRTVSR